MRNNYMKTFVLFTDAELKQLANDEQVIFTDDWGITTYYMSEKCYQRFKEFWEDEEGEGEEK